LRCEDGNMGCQILSIRIVESRSSLPCVKKPATRRFPEPYESSLRPPILRTVFLWYILILSSYITSSFPHINHCAFLPFQKIAAFRSNLE
jgi:hypothetical protein